MLSENPGPCQVARPPSAYHHPDLIPIARTRNAPAEDATMVASVTINPRSSAASETGPELLRVSR
jgi:hypothetical protein